MPNSPLAKVPYPSGVDAPAAAADMMALVMAMDSRLVLSAVDEADRDQKYADAPVSTMVVSGESRKIWVKTGPAPTNWWVVYERQEYTTGFTAASGWEIERAVAIVNTATIEVRLRLVRTGDDIVASKEIQTSPGNVGPDVDIATIPAQLAATVGDFEVIAPMRASVTSGAVSVRSNGLIRLYDLHTGSSIKTDHRMWISANWNQ